MTTRIDRERAFLEYQLKCRGGQGKLLDEAMIALDAIDAKTASLLQFNSMYLAGAIVLFGLILGLKNVTLLTRTFTLLTLVTIVVCILVATVLCLSCISIVGPHTGVTQMTVQEYETKVIQITTNRRTRYRVALAMSFASSILGVVITALLIQIGIHEQTIRLPDIKFHISSLPLQIGMVLVVIGISAVIALLVYKRWSVIEPHSTLAPENELNDAGGGQIARPAFSMILGGFLIAVLASLFWGLGNVITRFAAEDVYAKGQPGAVVDIALANYASGCLTILVFGFALHLMSRRREAFVRRPFFAAPWRLILAAVFKGVNTYLFVATVAVVSAGVAATLENFHIVWTAIFAAVLLKKRMPRSWIFSVAVILAGTALILRVWQPDSAARLGFPGMLLGVATGIAFALFVIVWNSIGDRADYVPARAFDTAVFLGLSGVVILLLHLVVGRLLFGGSGAIPFATLSRGALTLQFANGVFNIGLTYFLMNEAMKRMERLGSAASLLLCLGISYAVLFTLLGEAAIFHTPVTLAQWSGALLFSIGFATIRAGISTIDEESTTRTADAIQKPPGRVSAMVARLLSALDVRSASVAASARRLEIAAVQARLTLKRGAVSRAELTLRAGNLGALPVVLRIESVEIAGIPLGIGATRDIAPTRSNNSVDIKLSIFFGDTAAAELARNVAAGLAGTVLRESLVVPVRVHAQAEFHSGRVAVILSCEQSELRVSGYDLYATPMAAERTPGPSPVIPPSAPQP